MASTFCMEVKGKNVRSEFEGNTPSRYSDGVEVLTLVTYTSSIPGMNNMPVDAGIRQIDLPGKYLHNLMGSVLQP